MKTANPAIAQRILDYIARYQTEHDGQAPSIREIMRGCGYSSPSGVKFHLDRLVASGALIRAAGHARAYRAPAHPTGPRPGDDLRVADMRLADMAASPAPGAYDDLTRAIAALPVIHRRVYQIAASADAGITRRDIANRLGMEDRPAALKTVLNDLIQRRLLHGWTASRAGVLVILYGATSPASLIGGAR